MARNKKIYVINVSDELINMGFPTYIIGSRNIIPTIKQFAYDNIDEILKLNEAQYSIDTDNNVYEAHDDMPSNSLIEEIITRKEVIDQQAKGYVFDVNTATFVKDTFYIDMYSNHNRIMKFKRAVNGSLKSGDWIGYVHSAHRNKEQVVKKSIIINTIRWALGQGLAIPLFSILSLSSDDKSEFMKLILRVKSLHKVYDDIISHMSMEPNTGKNAKTKYNQQRDNIIEEIQSKFDSLLSEDNEDDNSKKQLGLIVMKKDKLFSIKSTRSEKARFIDTKTGKLKQVSTKMKEAKIKERLENEAMSYVKGKGIRYRKQKKVLDYYRDNPNAILRQAMRDLKMDHRTIKRYRNMTDNLTISVVKSAPKPSMYNNYIEQKVAEITTPSDGNNEKEKVTMKRTIEDTMKQMSDHNEMDRYTNMAGPIIDIEGDGIFERVDDY